MTNQQVDVELTALTEFSRAANRHAESFDKILHTLQDARVGSQSFGMIPGSGEVFAGYEERVEACLTSLGDCVSALHGIGQLVADCEEEYTQLDRASSEELSKVGDELSSGGLR